MKFRNLGSVVFLSATVAACGPEPTAAPVDDLVAATGANDVLPWAFVLNSPPTADAVAPDPDEIVTVPGSALSMRRGALIF